MTLLERFPIDKYNVTEVFDYDISANLLRSKCSCCWANGVLPDVPDYICLSIQSPLHKGDKQPVFVCKTELIKNLL